MREELDKLLTEKYPKMTVNRYGSEMDTCMVYGFAVGDGWFNLLDQLMGNIQHYIDWKEKQGNPIQQVTLDQVKSKFGGLRFYYTGGDDYISGMVSLAESKKQRVNRSRLVKIVEHLANVQVMDGSIQHVKNMHLRKQYEFRCRFDGDTTNFSL